MTTVECGWCAVDFDTWWPWKIDSATIAPEPFCPHGTKKIQQARLVGWLVGLIDGLIDSLVVFYLPFARNLRVCVCMGCFLISYMPCWQPGMADFF